MGRLLRRVAPLFLRCQPSDLGISTEVRSRYFGCPTVFLYDRVPGSVGLGQSLFRDHRAIVRAALDVVQGCECPQGCPACVGPVDEVGALGKETALRVLQHLDGGAQLQPREVELHEDDGA